MERARKETLVDELARTFKENSSILLLSFSGVTVPDETELRRQVAAAGSRYRVIKNRLAIRAAENTPLGELKAQFQGPTAIAVTDGDPVALAKALKRFIVDHPGMSFKAGLVEGQRVLSAALEGLAEVPSRSELLSKLLYLLNAPLTRLAVALQSPLRDLASVLKQLESKKK